MKIVLAFEHIRRLRGTHGDWVTAIGQGLARRGHDVHILCDSVADPELCPELTFHARRTFVKGESHRLLVLRTWALRQLRLLNADVGVSFHAAIPAEIVFPIQGFIQTRLAREFHEHRNPFWGSCLQMYPPVNERRCIEWLLRRDQKRVALFGVTSRLMRDILLERHPKLEGRIRLIPGASPLGPPDDETSRARVRTETRAALGLRDEDVVFLWGCNRIGWHGARYLLEAFAKATSGPGAAAERGKLILAGEGQWTLQRLAAKHSCLEKIRAIGRTRNFDRLLAASDVGVNPAILSHLGRFTWECLAFGKPVIVSAYSAGLDRLHLAGQRPAGRVVRPYDVTTLRQAITDLLDDSRRDAATKVAVQVAPSMRFELFLDYFENLLFERRGLAVPHSLDSESNAVSCGERIKEGDPQAIWEDRANHAGREGTARPDALPFALNSISAARHVDDSNAPTTDDES